LRHRFLIAVLAAAVVLPAAAAVFSAPPPRRDRPVPPALLPEAAATARPGDALFKDGAGLWGALASRFSDNDDGFGHVGLVARAPDGSLVVIHAGGDPASRQGRVQETPLTDFLAYARSAALYRPRVDDRTSAAAVSYARAAAARSAPFDGAFELESEDRLYCTELLWRALSEALGEDAVPEKSRRSGRIYIALDDLQESPWLAPVWRFEAPRPEV